MVLGAGPYWLIWGSGETDGVVGRPAGCFRSVGGR